MREVLEDAVHGRRSQRKRTTSHLGAVRARNAEEPARSQSWSEFFFLAKKLWVQGALCVAENKT